jgi:hypothetical protein
MEDNNLPPILINANYPKATIFRLFIALLMLMMALVIGLLILPYILGYLIIASFGIAAFFLQLINYFILKPKYVEIKENGVLFQYLWNKNRFVIWEDFKFININKGDLSTYIGSDGRRGVLCDRKWHYYRMNYEVASEVYKAYVEKVGKEPPHDATGVSGLP